jgi:hypothetical protein
VIDSRYATSGPRSEADIRLTPPAGVLLPGGQRLSDPPGSPLLHHAWVVREEVFRLSALGLLLKLTLAHMSANRELDKSVELSQSAPVPRLFNPLSPPGTGAGFLGSGL